MVLALSAMVIAASACNSAEKKEEAASAPVVMEEVYEAQLQPLNTNITKTQTNGTARFVISGDTLTAVIQIKDAPPGMEHWQHFHGFVNDSIATCASADQDKNKDGIVDVTETETVSGTTMVPFNAQPAEMQLGSDTYPKSGADGSYNYEVKIPLKQLEGAFAKSFGDSALHLDRRVLYIHGVPSDTKLPASVASVGDIPAQITLPIACGKIEKSAN